jgi:heme A synthase
MAAMLYYLSRPEVRFVTLTLLLAILAQFLLGVVTLINVVPISLASIHQAGACIVLVMTIFLLYVTQAGHRIENIDP